LYQWKCLLEHLYDRFIFVVKWIFSPCFILSISLRINQRKALWLSLNSEHIQVHTCLMSSLVMYSTRLFHSMDHMLYECHYLTFSFSFLSIALPHWRNVCRHVYVYKRIWTVHYCHLHKNTNSPVSQNSIRDRIWFCTSK
jgi:hypothetical protein